MHRGGARDHATDYKHRTVTVSATDDLPPAERGGDQLEPGERAELERLRAEMDRLRARPPAQKRRRLGWRSPVAALLIVVGCLLAPVSVIAVWTANQVSDTNRYVANIAPLVHEPAIQNALTDKITSQITTHLHAIGLTDRAASQLSRLGLDRAANLLKSVAPSIASALTGFIRGQVHKIVTSSGVAQLWVRLNRTAHAELVKTLSGRGSRAITVRNGLVTLNLGPFIDVVKHRIAARGLTIVDKLPPINPTFPLFSAKYLVKAQTAYRLLNDLKIVLPILALLLLGAGVYVARNHRRALIGAGLGVATSMFVLAAGLLIFRSIYLGSVPDSKLPADAAAVLFDTLVRFIRAGLRTLLVLGLVVAAAAFLTGSSVTAIRARSSVSSGLGWVRTHGELAGLRTGPVGTWTYAHRKALRIGATAIAVLVFVFWGKPTGAVVIAIAAVLLAVLGLIELIGRPPGQATAAGGPRLQDR
jgi:hypothetical protein